MHILATTIATGAKKLIHKSAVLSMTINAAGLLTSFSHLNDANAAATVDAAAAAGTTIYQAGSISQAGKLAGIVWTNQ